MKITFKEMNESIKFWYRWSVLFPAMPLGQPISDVVEFRQTLGKSDFKIMIDYSLEGCHSMITLQK